MGRRPEPNAEIALRSAVLRVAAITKFPIFGKTVGWEDEETLRELQLILLSAPHLRGSNCIIQMSERNSSRLVTILSLAAFTSI
jgi:hypothetical protein